VHDRSIHRTMRGTHAAALALCCIALTAAARAQPTGPESRSLGAPPASAAADTADAAPGVSGWRTSAALGGVIALAVVAAGIVRIVARRNGGLLSSISAGGKAPSGIMEVLGRYPVGRGSTLVLLKLDRRILLLSQSSTGRFGAGGAFSTLTEITDPEEVGSILVKTRDDDGDSMAERFRTILGKQERGLDVEEQSSARRTVRNTGGDRVEIWDDRSGIPVVDLTRQQGAGAAGALRKRLAQFGRAAG
jgi:hypothetical protein